MGHPKRQRKKFSRPLKPYDKERISRDTAIMKKYGIRRKKELWRAEAILRVYRQRARKLLADPNEKMREEMLARLNKLGISASTPEDVLTLRLEDVLARRLQTIVQKKGIAKTHKESRQLIVHKKITVDGRVMRWPSYLVPVEKEGKIKSLVRVSAPAALPAENEGSKN